MAQVASLKNLEDRVSY